MLLRQEHVPEAGLLRLALEFRHDWRRLPAVLRLVELALVDFLWGADLLDASRIHDDDAIGHGHRFDLIVGHVHRRVLEFVVEAPDFETHFRAQVGIEVGERLVEQQDIGLGCERAGERDTLLLSARELRGVAFGLCGELGGHEQRLRATALLGLRQRLHLQSVRDVFAHRHVRPDRVALEDHAHVAPFGRNDCLGRRYDRAADANLAVIGLGQAGDHAQGRGLAATRRTEQADELAVGDR